MPIPVRGGGLSDEGLSVELKGLPVDEVYTVNVDGEPLHGEGAGAPEGDVRVTILHRRAQQAMLSKRRSASKGMPPTGRSRVERVL